MTYSLDYVPGWDLYFNSFDKPLKLRILKKLEQLKDKAKSRHLRYGLPYFIEEVGGYRIAFKASEEKKIKLIYFIGDHKQYEKWIATQI